MAGGLQRILAAATIAFSGAALRALWQGLNPKVRLSDILDIHSRRAYVVDVSLQGPSTRLSRSS